MERKTDEIDRFWHHKWCQHCGASVQQIAQICRFCQSSLAQKNTSSEANHSAPEGHLEECRHWLPEMDELVAKLPDCAYKQYLLEKLQAPSWLDESDISAAEHKRYHESNIGLTNPIAPADRALILDILCALASANVAISEICATPKLRVLDISEACVIEELNQRRQESLEDRRCPYCAESVTNEAVTCRFCQSDFSKPPTKRSLIEEAFMRDVLLHLTVQQAIVDPNGHERIAPVLSRTGISAEEIEQAVKKKRYETAESVPTDLPKSNWLQRVIREGLSDGLDDYHALHEMVNLGKCLSSENRFEEAELVLNHAMSLARHYKNVGSVPGTEAMLTGLIRNCTLHLSFLYEETGRYSEAEDFHVDFANETDFSCIPELNKVLQAMAESVAPSNLLRRANLCLKQEKFEEAEGLYIQALEGLERPIEETPNNGAKKEVDTTECNEILRLLKTALGDIGAPVETLPVQEEVEEDFANNGHSEHSLAISKRLNVINCLTDLYLAQEQLAKAEQMVAQANQLLESVSGDQLLAEKIEIWSRQAEIHARQNKHDQAEPLLKLCIDSLEGMASNVHSHKPKEIAQTLAVLTQRHSGCLENLH